MRLKLLSAQLFFPILFIGLSSFAFSQTPTNSDARKIIPNGEPGNISRYGVDYELINYEFDGDSTILNLLDLKAVEYLRHDSMDQAYRDLENNVIILLYSRQKMMIGTPAELIEKH